MEIEQGLRRFRDADAWPAEEAMAAMLDNQLGGPGRSSWLDRRA